MVLRARLFGGDEMDAPGTSGWYKGAVLEGGVTMRVPGMSRRELLRGGAAAVVASCGVAGRGETTTAGRLELSVMGEPDLMVAYVGEVEATRTVMARAGSTWRPAGAGRGTGCEVALRPGSGGMGSPGTGVVVRAAGEAVQRIHLRWRRALPESARVLGDAWERSYGELEWLPMQAERVLPWYGLVQVGEATSGFGVKVGAASFAFWQVDPEGISLWLDLRNGANGVLLGKRELRAAVITVVAGEAGESAFAVTRRLCTAMAEGVAVPSRRGRMPLNMIFGSNDWYYAYGQNTPEGILRDAALMRELAPPGEARPFTVIDDGYQDATRFPSMARLAEEIRRQEVAPGVWIRPLRAAAGTKPGMLLPAARWGGAEVVPAQDAAPAYDPTVPEGMAAIAAVVREACGWGYDLIKHDFSTYELLGQWGSQMGASPTRGSWHMSDRTRTNAEVITALYGEIRRACGEERVLLGCNTVGHLAVGHFDAQRTGDDVSGRVWERTRRMGVNTLAFRLPQHGVFFRVDADCVPVTPDVPWRMTAQWMQAVAQSGSVLLVSPDPKAVGAEQRRAMREAFALCVSGSSGGPASEPVDWMSTRTPREWREARETSRYEWLEEGGASPFSIGVAMS